MKEEFGVYGFGPNADSERSMALCSTLYDVLNLLTLAAAYTFPIEEKVREEYVADEQRKHGQKVNRTNTLAMTRDILIGVFVRKEIRQALDAFDQIVYKTREIVRPNRSVNQKPKPKRQYHMNYKRL